MSSIHWERRRLAGMNKKLCRRDAGAPSGQPLDGLVVLDLADEQGSFCSKLLADLGATVIKIEDPDGEPSRTTTSFLYHNTNKLGITLDLKHGKSRQTFRKFTHKADVLIESFRSGHLAALNLDYNQLRRINPRLIHLSITGFGQTETKSHYRDCDILCSASGGQMHVSRDSSGKPLKLFGPQPCYAASLFGANAVLLNLRKRKITGKGCHIDLSIQEAVASTLDHVMIDYLHYGKISGKQSDMLQREPFSILRCRDGYIQIPILRNWETLCELMTSEGTTNDLSGKKWRSKAYCENNFPHIVKAVESWTGNHTKQELFELGQSMRFPWAPIESPEEVRKSPQLKARRFFVRLSPAARQRAGSLPGLPYKLRSFPSHPPKPAPLRSKDAQQVLAILGNHAKNYRVSSKKEIASGHSVMSGEILRGIRVLDLTRMLSGPYATRILADFGAEVIKVQSRLTATGAERNDTPYFRAWNRNKKSISLNLSRPDAREILLELVSISDIVVENFSPRVLANWGLSYQRLCAVKPDLIMASISAMGQTGPWKNYVGFAPTFHALSGLTCASSRSDGAPADIGHAYADVVAGLYASMAILASLEYRDQTGNGQYIDLSAYEAMCTLLGSALIDASTVSNREINDGGHALFCGCYPCKGDDRWCAIAISNEAEWQAFCEISNLTALKSSEFSSPIKRRNRSEALDRLIRQWTARYSAGTIVPRLQKAGIAAAVVQNAADMAKDSQLSGCNFFVSLKHPLLGKSYSDRSALWPWKETTGHWKAAPALGEDNHYVFVELLGRSEAEFKGLAKKGILD
jgi:crotonobetainyl-CoA:carnitine CoA-transferase CaiB-like acyl-CoA transferase